jgi:hypothetical protein
MEDHTMHSDAEDALKHPIRTESDFTTKIAFDEDLIMMEDSPHAPSRPSG